MKRLNFCLGIALAACLSVFSFAASAKSLGEYHFAKAMIIAGEPQGVAMTRLELTLAQWRSEQHLSASVQRSDMRADSNGLVFNSVPEPLQVAENC